VHSFKEWDFIRSTRVLKEKLTGTQCVHGT